MDTQPYRTMLEGRLSSLKKRIHKAEDILGAEHTKDWEDQAIEREGEEVVEALSQTDAQEIARIEAALSRIDAGTYGTCVQCGESISKDRLNVVPASPICKTCARAAESSSGNTPV